ncbi:5695_t:CDS:1, partial [Dentiscutata erythropus]
AINIMSLRKQHVSIACDRCRKKRRKCVLISNYDCENCSKQHEKCIFTTLFKKRGPKPKKKQINTFEDVNFLFVHSNKQQESYNSQEYTQVQLPTENNLNFPFLLFNQQETQCQNFHQQSQPTTSPIIMPAQQTYTHRFITLPRFDFDDSRFETLIGKMTQKQAKECLSTLERRCDILKHTL